MMVRVNPHTAAADNGSNQGKRGVYKTAQQAYGWTRNVVGKKALQTATSKGPHTSLQGS